mgnify:CR=1 FL=1
MLCIEAGIVILLPGSPLRDHEVIPHELRKQSHRDCEVIPKKASLYLEGLLLNRYYLIC